MSHESTVTRLFDSYQEHDVGSVMSLVAPDLQFVDHPLSLTLGPEDFADWLAGGLETFPDVTIHDLRLVASGDTVVSLFVEEATHRGALPTADGEIAGTNRRIRLPICFVFEFGPDGLIHSGETYYDLDTLTRQVTT